MRVKLKVKSKMENADLCDGVDYTEGEDTSVQNSWS